MVGRRHYERTDAGVGDGLQPEEHLPTPSGEDDTALVALLALGVEGGLLLVAGFDVEGRR